MLNRFLGGNPHQYMPIPIQELPDRSFVVRNEHNQYQRQIHIYAFLIQQDDHLLGRNNHYLGNLFEDLKNHGRD